MLAPVILCSIVMTACLSSAAAQDAPKVEKDAAPAITAEQAKVAAAALKTGLEAKDAPERVAALQHVASVDHDDVAKVAGGALADKEEAVRLAAAEVLGGMTCKESLTVLHRAAEKKEHLQESRTAAAYFKAIGRHGDTSSIKVLAFEPLKNMDADVVRARVYGLGNIRSTESVEELMKLMQLGNPTPGQDSAYMPTFRVALARLTGTDQTTNKDMWQTWWRENKGRFKVAETPPQMPAELQAEWNEYWGVVAETRDAAEEADPAKSGR